MNAHASIQLNGSASYYEGMSQAWETEALSVSTADGLRPVYATLAAANATLALACVMQKEMV